MRIFRGYRTLGGPVVEFNARLLDASRSQKIRNHSPTGFEWGYGGSGPAQLALAIMLEVLPRDFAEEKYQRFKREVIGRLPPVRWEITEEEIERWLECGTTPEAINPLHAAAGRGSS